MFVRPPNRPLCWRTANLPIQILPINRHHQTLPFHINYQTDVLKPYHLSHPYRHRIPAQKNIYCRALKFLVDLSETFFRPWEAAEPRGTLQH